MTDTAREFSSKKRKELAKEGKALPDGSFPIVTKGDLRNAIQAYGRASNKAQAKRHIIKRARALGATDMLPDDWKGSDNAADDAAQVKLYYFEGRNTGIAATSATEARKKKKRGGDKIVAIRTPNEDEKKKMRRGEWVRTRKDGKSPKNSKYGKGRGYGPPRDKASNMIPCEHEGCTRTFLDPDQAADHAEVVHSFSDTMRSARSVVREKYGRDSYIRDIGDGWMVIGMYNDGDTKLLKLSYTAESGKVVLGDDEQEVVHRNAYLPASKQESAEIAMSTIGVGLTPQRGGKAAKNGVPLTDLKHEFAQDDPTMDPFFCTTCGRYEGHAVHS